MASALHIEVNFDLICPWCLIGKRHLDMAVAEWRRLRPGLALSIAWHGTSLLPDTPADGWPFRAFYLRRLGSAAAVAAREAQVCEAGLAAGVYFDFDRIAVLPNTRAAHALIERVAGSGDANKVEPLIDALYDAHFMRGQDIGDAQQLARLAEGLGIRNQPATGARPSPSALCAQVPPGVPHVVFNGRSAVTGAVGKAVLLEQMLREVDAPVLAC